ncbi:MAG: carboxymuconolactone decarboxylase family protein [Acidimicrobiales bacterium]
MAKVANEAAVKAGVPPSTIDLIETRASQINGCAVCLDMHSRAAKKHGTRLILRENRGSE